MMVRVKTSCKQSMLRSKFQILLILLTGLLTMGTTCCKKEVPEKKPDKVFAGTFTLNPYKKIYNINDTIWISFETTDKILLDTLTNTKISADTTFFVYGFEYEKRYPHTSNTIDTFYSTIASGIFHEYLLVKPRFTTFDFYSDCNTSGGYTVKVGFKLKTTGIYSINLRGGAGLIKCPNKIVDFPFSGIWFKFNLPDCNKDIYLSIPKSDREESLKTEELIDKKEIFVFKVQ